MGARARFFATVGFALACLLPAFANGQAYRFSFAFGDPGSGPGQFNWPAGLLAGGDGNLYVADRDNARIQVFDPNGKYVSQFGTEQLYGPTGVARDGAGNFYVVDSARDRVQVFDSAGELLFGFGESGSGPGQFQLPLRVAVQSSGNVLVADHFGRRVQIFDSSGNYLAELRGAGGHGFNNTWAVAVDGVDQIYVVDVGSECAHVF